MLDDDTSRSILTAYHESTEGDEGVPVPLLILHGIREEITVRPHIELPSAYHMAHYIHDFVNDNTVAITVCGRFFKQIGDQVFQGTILYHVDRIGSHLIRGIDTNTGRYNVLDDSPYWNQFPYDFDDGPMDPDTPIGYHPGPNGEEDLDFDWDEDDLDDESDGPDDEDDEDDAGDEGGVTTSEP